MTSQTMMALGPYRFSMATAAYQDLERNNEYRWPTVERIGVAPARQWTGPGDETINMRGVIYPHYRGTRRGLEQVPEMRAAASLGTPLLMVDGAGRVWGMYVITSIREGHKTLFSDGRPRCVDFDISLGAYGG